MRRNRYLWRRLAVLLTAGLGAAFFIRLGIFLIRIPQISQWAAGQITEQTVRCWAPSACYAVQEHRELVNSPGGMLLLACIGQWQICRTPQAADSLAALSEGVVQQEAAAYQPAGPADDSPVFAGAAPEQTALPSRDEPAPDDPAASGEAAAENPSAGGETPSGGTDGSLAVSRSLAPAGHRYTAEELSDYDTLLNTFFTLDPTTAADSTLINGASLLAKDMTITKDPSVPQILVYHTHSQEAFADSREGERADTIVGAGDYLVKLLTEQYGYQVIHDDSTYDVIDGELDRNKAYSTALEGITPILEANPSIQVVIDLHRDGIEGNKMTAEANGKEAARFMFFNGLSRSAKNGEISYLYNPYRQDNLAFSLQMQLAAQAYYPGIARPIYLKCYRYNLHLKPRSLLIECGSQKNTVEEIYNSVEVIADLLDRVLTGAW